MWRSYLFGGGCAVLLGGCAITSETAPAGTRYDGMYVSQDRLVSGAAFQCGAPELSETIEVRDGRFAYPFQVSPPRVVPLPVEIAADGKVAGQMQYGMDEELFGLSRLIYDWALLRGQISGTAMDATVTTLRCARRLTGQRSAD
jgi:hypothetical protein